ncbi:unnamed protein product, partial [Larinioides sclopetarius]
MESFEDIDLELFIGEVKKSPEIWNVADENYCDRKRRRTAWTSICRMFCENFDKKPDN